MKLINKPVKLLAKGFTLAELVVSIAITVILLTVLIALANLATTSLETATSSVQRSDSAQSYLEYLTTDLQNVVIKPGDSGVWLYVGEGLEGGSEALNTSTKGKLITNNASLTFFTAASDRYDGDLGGKSDEGGDVACVNYEIRYLNSNNTMSGASSSDLTSKATYNGYRSLVDPDDTYRLVLLGVNKNVREDIEVTTNTGTALDASGVSQATEGLLSKVSNELNGSKDVICDGLIELTCVFNVEYTDSSDTTKGSVVKQKLVTIRPIVDDAGKEEPLQDNKKFRIDKKFGSYASISGTRFTSNIKIKKESGLESDLKGGDSHISNVKAKSITVILNVMDKNTQRRVSQRPLSQSDILKECRSYTTTVQLP